MNWEVARLMTLTKKQDISVVNIDSKGDLQAIEELKEGEEIKQSKDEVSKSAVVQRYISDSQLIVPGVTRGRQAFFKPEYRFQHRKSCSVPNIDNSNLF